MSTLTVVLFPAPFGPSRDSRSTNSSGAQGRSSYTPCVNWFRGAHRILPGRLRWPTSRGTPLMLRLMFTGFNKSFAYLSSANAADIDRAVVFVHGLAGVRSQPG